jgi:hypothetical protein
MDDDRARRLAAIEARLNPAPAATDSPGSGSSGTSSPAPAARGPLFGAPRPAQPTGWVRPSPKAEAERRRELARILNRTVVRDNSYADAAGCVEVSRESESGGEW